MPLKKTKCSETLAYTYQAFKQVWYTDESKPVLGKSLHRSYGKEKLSICMNINMPFSPELIPRLEWHNYNHCPR